MRTKADDHQHSANVARAEVARLEAEEEMDRAAGVRTPRHRRRRKALLQAFIYLLILSAGTAYALIRPLAPVIFTSLPVGAPGTRSGGL